MQPSSRLSSRLHAPFHLLQLSLSNYPAVKICRVSVRSAKYRNATKWFTATAGLSFCLHTMNPFEISSRLRLTRIATLSPGFTDLIVTK